MSARVKLKWNGQAIRKAERAAAQRGLALAAEHVLGESRKQVPIEEATLERSGVAQVDPSSLTASVSYDTPYAVRQHEELTWQHDAGRKAKYLEDPMNAEGSTVHRIVASELRRGLT